MNKLFYVLLLSITSSFSAVSYPQSNHNQSYTKLNNIKDFWRNEPVIGRWLSVAQGQIIIPKYMEKTSFPYKGRGYKKEVPFADNLAVVRLLGGWDYRKKRGELNGQKNADLVFFKNNKLNYRWNLLKGRLDPYINAGYENLTLVLDNIPWDLPKQSKINSYGQVNPPYDMKRWGIFIKKMVRQLVLLYGYEIVKNFRFRIGTENQHKARFNGTTSQYRNLYLSTQQAIYEVLPDAQIGPFNFGGGKTQLHKTNVNMKKLMSFTEKKKQLDRLSVDFLPVSTYYVVRKKHKKNIKTLLDIRSKANKKYFGILSKISNKDFPKEIHEFGILNNTLNGVHSSEPGVRGAAWRMYMIQNMMENNISKLYHWGTFDRVAKGKYLLKGNGWNYSILEYLVGGEAYSLPTVTDNGLHHKTFVVKKNQKVYLLTTIFPDTKNTWLKKKLTIDIPILILPKKPPKTLKWTYLTKSTSVIDIIHDEFLYNNILDTVFLSDINVVGRIIDMGRQKGKKHVLQHWEKYTQTIIDSLTLKPYSGTYTVKDNSLQLNIDIELPSVNLIELSF